MIVADESITQLEAELSVEFQIFNLGVVGSSPTGLTTRIAKFLLKLLRKSRIGGEITDAGICSIPPEMG